MTSSSPVAAPDASVYTDLSGLSALKRGAANNDPATIREVAKQFESLFTRMMLKSMRDAVGPDPTFGSDQEQMYQGMYDDQMSIQMSRGRGLGLADMLVSQLQRMGVAGAKAASAGGTTGSDASAGSASIYTGPGRRGSYAGAGAYLATQKASATESQGASVATQTDFVHDLWPQAQQAGHQLGVDPGSLIAQAALETNWGRNLPQDSAGRSSNNLFGIKASGDWSGATVDAPTQEYESGVATATTSQFRAYASPAQSVQDYVALLRSNPRYTAAHNTGSDVEAFANGLQRGGYATDPNYARKITAIAHNVAGVIATGVSAPAGGVTDLKSDAALPITADTGTL
jgi:flagellar protein FlgJ